MSHRLYFDHDSSYSALVHELRRREQDCLVSSDVGMAEAPDAEQLEFAASSDRVLITANQSDFSALHWQWMAGDRHHAGIVIAPQLMDLKLKMSRLRYLLTTASRDDLADALVYLNSWRPAGGKPTETRPTS